MDNLDKAYQNKTREYFWHIRQEILPLLPSNSDKIFEVGCGAGETLAFLKESGRCDWAGGIELSHNAAEIARGKLDLVLEGDIETMDLPIEEGSLDVILCLDVLEHLIDPWFVVENLHELLKPGGVMICSIPNIRNFRAVLPLLLLGRWRYTKDGILDKTHLRFFTKESAIQLLESSCFIVEIIQSTGLEKWGKAFFINLFSLSIFKSFFEYQYIIKAKKKFFI